MKDMPACPECGADVSAVVRDHAISLIERWRSSRLISSELADRLRSDLHHACGASPAPSRKRWPGVAITPSMALLLIGGILVVSAVVMVGTELWDELSPSGRLGTVGVPAALFYACAAYLRARRLTSEWVVSGFALIGACMAPFVVWLAMGMSQPIPNDEADVAGWVAVAAAGGLAVQIGTLAWLRTAPLTAPPSFTTIMLLVSLTQAWSGRRSGAPVSEALVVAGVLLMAIGQSFWRSGRSGHAAAPNLVGVMAALIGLTVLAAEKGALYEALSLGAPIGLIVAACRPAFRPYLWAGAVFLVINTFRFGLSHFATSLGLPIAVMMCGLVSIIIGYVVHRVRKEYE